MIYICDKAIWGFFEIRILEGFFEGNSEIMRIMG
jgi:hypothetical protein